MLAWDILWMCAMRRLSHAILGWLGIPLDERPHLNDGIRQWHGDSRGHWDGDTLVVDTRNYTDKTNFRGSGKDAHLVERFTRVGPNALLYEYTIEDPASFGSHWSAAIPMRKNDAPL